MPPIPTPPVTTTAPSVDDVDSVPLFILATPETLTELRNVDSPVTSIVPAIITFDVFSGRTKLPPMNVFPFIAAPPFGTLKVPVSILVAAVVPITLTVSGIKLPSTVIFLLARMLPPITNSPEISNHCPPMYVLPLTYNPPSFLITMAPCSGCSDKLFGFLIVVKRPDVLLIFKTLSYVTSPVMFIF